MTKPCNQKSRNSEKGIALFTAIFTVLLITAIGAGMIMLTNTDTSISANFRDEQKAFFAAKAGMEEIRDRFRSSANNSLAANLPTVVPGNANAFVYVLNPKNGEPVTPWVTNGNANVYPDTEICTEMANMGTPCGGNPPAPAGGGWYTTANASPTYAMNPVSSWKWTRINLKTNRTSSGTTTVNTVDPAFGANALVCWNGAFQIATNQATCSAVNPNYLPVYVMTTLAMTPSGSRRMVQAEAISNNFPTLPGPMIFDGANPVFNTPNSNAFAVSGNDIAQGGNNGAGCPAAIGEPALGAYNDPAVTILTGDANNRPQSYVGPLQYGTPSVANVSSQLTMLSTVGGLESLASAVTLVAGNENNVYGNNPSTILNPGTNANPQINVVNGNLTLPGGWTGSGILLVTGNLTFQGNPNYNGLILVIGKGSVTKNGGGNGIVNGSLLVANLYGSNGALLPASSAPGVPYFNWNGGGTVSWNYDSCWSTMMNGLQAYRIVAVREMMY
ncbi:MAG TPA: pilus assembly PilX N-terminal domain-containing protein [Candidatus Sulfotelmatobacter sp.]|nr:pilus assembly PilX N-terminal domain-containing protein [Candidatus Sulfotelmatobacter sp.]